MAAAAERSTAYDGSSAGRLRWQQQLNDAQLMMAAAGLHNTRHGGACTDDLSALTSCAYHMR
jgi:hypothetical protein